MEPKAVPTGAAAICRACEVVWLDRQALGSLPVRAAEPEGQPTLDTQTQAARCPQCGAPIANSWDEHCRYCGAAIHAPTKVVVLPSGSAEDQEIGTGGGRTGRTGLFGEVLRALSRPIE
jgi:hypothetical protein